MLLASLFFAPNTYLIVTSVDLTVWIISALIALGVGWSRYAKAKTLNKIVREMAAMVKGVNEPGKNRSRARQRGRADYPV